MGRSQGSGDLESPQDNVVVDRFDGDGELRIWEIHLTVLECSGGAAWQTMLTMLDNLSILKFKEAQHGRLCVPRASPRHGFEEEQSESSHIHEDQVGQNCGSI